MSFTAAPLGKAGREPLKKMAAVGREPERGRLRKMLVGNVEFSGTLLEIHPVSWVLLRRTPFRIPLESISIEEYDEWT